MPLAASKDPLISFIVAGEGTPVTAGEESVHGHASGDGNGWDRDKVWRADTVLRQFKGNHGFDPMPVLRKLEVPTLWLFGLHDSVVPIIPSLERLEALITGGKTNNQIHIFPFGDHNFNNTATGEGYDLTGVVEDWFQEIGIL